MNNSRLLFSLCGENLDVGKTWHRDVEACPRRWSGRSYPLPIATHPTQNEGNFVAAHRAIPICRETPQKNL